MGGQLIAGQRMAQGVLTLAVQPAMADQTVAVAAEVEEVDGDALAHVGVAVEAQVFDVDHLDRATCAFAMNVARQGGDVGKGQGLGLR
ncbi:hypothetical protein LTR94_035692, partial [Friedmanniomyces endolithicus]